MHTLQHTEIVKIRYKNGESWPGIMKFVRKFELFGQASDVKNRICVLRARTPANIASVAQSVGENPGLSISRRSLELEISQTTLHRIFCM